jgi:hypothetical protein
VIEGVCGAAGVPLSFLTPAHWKRLVGIAPGKEGVEDVARSEAIRRWPTHAALFTRVKDDGRAEACLIGAIRKRTSARRASDGRDHMRGYEYPVVGLDYIRSDIEISVE